MKHFLPQTPLSQKLLLTLLLLPTLYISLACSSPQPKPPLPPLSPFEKNKIQQLIQQLNSPNWQTRENATEQLIQMGQHYQPYLLNILKRTSSLEIQWRLQYILATFGWIKPRLAKKLKKEIQNFLHHHTYPKHLIQSGYLALPILLKQLQNPYPPAVILALKLLEQLEDKRVAMFLHPYLLQIHHPLHERFVLTLKKIGNPKSIPFLAIAFQLHSSYRPYHYPHCLHALLQLTGPAGGIFLLDFLQKPLSFQQKEQIFYVLSAFPWGKEVYLSYQNARKTKIELSLPPLDFFAQNILKKWWKKYKKTYRYSPIFHYFQQYQKLKTHLRKKIQQKL
ncbi:MAG: HEAT repeat domain-containing protein [Planctomycetota bacterium]|nr:MAG: HEAT repeat domain-containing protein [Planctomycetota bacterium]